MTDYIALSQSDLGIDKGSVHHMELTMLEAECLNILQRGCVGIQQAMAANTLASLLFGIEIGPEDDPAGVAEQLEAAKRNLRALINHLIIEHQIPILSSGGRPGGYWIPETKNEEEMVYAARKKRAFTGMVKACKGRKASYVQDMEQMLLWFDEPEGHDAIRRLRLPVEKDPVPAWVRLTTRLLDRFSRDPQRYAAEIAELQRQFGDIFVPKATVAKLRSAATTIQELLKEVAA